MMRAPSGRTYLDNGRGARVHFVIWRNNDRGDSMREVLAITNALADESRVRALIALTRGQLCVCQIAEFLQLAPSTVSRHLSILRQVVLVEYEKRGRWMYYS